MNLYYKDELLITDNIAGIPLEDGNTKHIVFIICADGKMTGQINGTHYSLSKHHALGCRPGSHLSQIMVSTDWKCSILCFNVEAFSQLMYVSKQVWSDIQYIIKNPVMLLSDKDFSIIMHYYDALVRKLSTDDVPYKREVVQCLSGCIILELLSILERNVPLSTIEKPVRQTDNITKKFMEIVTEEGGKIRSVAEVAERLNITPKYLSFVVKRHSGNNAYGIIRDATFQAVSNRLLYTGMTVKEIASEFNFPTLSIFGKFIKDRTGLSPTQYRHQNQE
ncbi:MAG: AraC family transcriptional regulator [Bacteroidales bacterium]|nr:AraC family transcriptional regulator [Bacteroidales bacterium]